MKKDVNLRWIHVFKQMIDSGDLIKMKPAAVVTYLVLKAESDFYDGNVVPGFNLLLEKTGLSKRGLSLALKKLEEMDYIKIHKTPGKMTRYEVLEKFVISDKEIATFKYIGSSIKTATKELSTYLTQKEIPSGGFQFIQIENLQIVFNFEGLPSEILENIPKEKMSEVLEIVEKVGRKEMKAWKAVQKIKILSTE